MLPASPYPPNGTTVYPTRSLVAVHDPLPWTPHYLSDITPTLRAAQTQLARAYTTRRVRVLYARGFALHSLQRESA